jgi:hypothetical protein
MEISMLAVDRDDCARIVLTCLTCEEMYKRINGLTVGIDSQFSYFPTDCQYNTK